MKLEEREPSSHRAHIYYCLSIDSMVFTTLITLSGKENNEQENVIPVQTVTGIMLEDTGLFRTRENNKKRTSKQDMVLA